MQSTLLAFWSLGLVVWGIWILFITERPLELGIEGERPWFKIDGIAKKALGLIAMVGGVLLFLTR